MKSRKKKSAYRHSAVHPLTETPSMDPTIYERIPIGYQSLDEKGHFIHVNQTWLDIFGYTREEVIGHSFGDFLDPEWIDLFKERFPRFRRIGEVLGVDFKIRCKNGSMIHVRLNGSIEHDENGHFLKTHCFITDISTQKQVEEAHKLQGDRLRLALEATSDGLWDWNVATNEVYFSPRYYTMLGYEPDELPAAFDTWESLLHPEDRGRALQVVRDHIESKREIFAVEFRLKTKTGRWRWILGRGKVMERDENENPVRMIGTHVDISLSKNAERAIRKSEEKLNAMLASIGDHMSMMDRDFNIIWANSTARNMFGSHIVGRKCYEVFHGRKEPCDPQPCLTLKAFQDGRIHQHETRVTDQNGNHRYLHCTANVALRDKDGRPTAVIEVSKDITRLVETQAALEESEESYRKLSENLPGMVFRLYLNEDKRMKFFNNMLETMTGYQAEELACNGLCYIESLIVPEDRSGMVRSVQESILNNTIYEVEYRIRHKDGDIRYFLERGRPVLDRDGHPSHIDGVVLDQTKRKQAEKAMNRQLEEQISLFESIDEAIYVSDPDTYEILYANAVTKETFDRDIVGRKCYQALQGLEQPCDFCTNAIIFEKNPGHPHVWEFKNKLTGRWYHCIDKVISWPDGRKVRYELAVDIHEHKLAEESLRASENLYRVLTENVADGVVIYQNGKMVFANASFSRMTGYEVNTLLRMDPEKLFQDEDKNMFKNIVEDFENDIPGGSVESLLLHRNGSELWTEAEYNIIQWKGEAALLGTVRDITEHKFKEMEMVREKEHLRKENLKLRAGIKDRYRFGDMIGKSDGMQQVYELIMRAAGSDANVVIHGESGTGKELIARTIHAMSDLNQNAFVPVNCGAVPEALFESEFFGYKKGAFTGANMDKHGFFDTARDGTLFLDEVGELTLSMQAKLLRAVEGGGYVPVGSNRVKKTQARIIAATNRDLSDMVQKGLFREDFFYRLHVIPIDVPPLRRRKEDIPLLVDHFLRKNQTNGKPKSISGRILEMLINHDWPGNVRELQNLLSRYLSLNRLDFITPGPPPGPDMDIMTEDEAPLDGMGLRDVLETFEKGFLVKSLKRNRWHKGKTAEQLKIPERTLYRKLKQYQLN